MNSSNVQRARRPAHPSRDPMAYVARRLSSIAVGVGAFAGLVSAAIVEAAGFSGPIAAGAGLVVFVAAASLAAIPSAGRRMTRRGDGPS